MFGCSDYEITAELAELFSPIKGKVVVKMPGWCLGRSGPEVCPHPTVAVARPSSLPYGGSDVLMDLSRWSFLASSVMMEVDSSPKVYGPLPLVLTFLSYAGNSMGGPLVTAEGAVRALCSALSCPFFKMLLWESARLNGLDPVKALIDLAKKAKSCGMGGTAEALTLCLIPSI